MLRPRRRPATTLVCAALLVAGCAGAETPDGGDEQPFTRTQTGLRIPPDVRQVVVEGRDSRNGWGGTTVRVPVP